MTTQLLSKHQLLDAKPQAVPLNDSINLSTRTKASHSTSTSTATAS